MNLPPLGNSYVEFHADTSALTMRRVVDSGVSALFDHNYLDAPISEYHYCGSSHGGYIDAVVRYENPLYKIANPTSRKGKVDETTRSLPLVP